jgi:hypothetical protein
MPSNSSINNDFNGSSAIMSNYSLILLNNYPNDEWSISDNDYANLVWLSPSQKPTKEELDAQWDAVVAKIEAGMYKAMRAAEYPPMTDYLDGIVKGDQAQIDKYIADCQAIKAKYPKPN